MVGMLAALCHLAKLLADLGVAFLIDKDAAKGEIAREVKAFQLRALLKLSAILKEKERKYKNLTLL